jgi:hypothetical protein
MSARKGGNAIAQGIADLADRAVVEILRHVDTGDLGAAGAGEQTHLEPCVPHDPHPVSWRQALLPRLHEGGRGR